MTKPKKTGRPPVVSKAVLDAINARPGDGLTCGQLADIAGVTHQAVRDALRSLRCVGVVRLVRGRVSMAFASQAHADAWRAAHPALRVVSRKSAEWHQLISGAVSSAPGSSSADVAKAIGMGCASCRRAINDMERSGDLWRAGPLNRLVWFTSEAARDAARASIDAAHAAHKAKIRAHKVNAGQRRAAQKHTFSIAAKTAQDKAASVRTKAAKAPPTIVGMDSAKVTICRPCDVERYRVSGPVIGGFATLGVGRYLEPQ